jgi:glutathione S-transferase
MKLYYSPGACSLSPHIVAVEAGIPIDLVKVDLKTHKTESGEDYYGVNPKGYVPALVLDDGTKLTEGPAIVQYLADRKAETKLAPPANTIERYKLMEWLTFINGEIHKPFGALFGSKSEDAKAESREKIVKRFAYVEKELTGRQFLLNDTFTVADAYLFVMLTWAKSMKIDFPANLTAYFDRIAERPGVKQAMSEEGLNKKAA